MIKSDWLEAELLSGGILHLQLRKAPVNAFNTATLIELGELFCRLKGDEKVKAIVMSSALKVFSAGLNLKEARHFDVSEQTAILNGFHYCFLQMFSFPKPLIVAVEGAAIAGGFFPVLCSDYRIAGFNATFGLTEVKVGVGFPTGLVEIVRSMMSPNDMRLIMQTGKPLSAKQALKVQIVDECVRDGEALRLALVIAKDYADLPPIAYATVKQQVRAPVIQMLKEQMNKAATSKPQPWFNKETSAAMAHMIESTKS